MNQVMSVRNGARLSTLTSTVMTVLLLGSMGSGWLSVLLLSAAGLGFELLKWSSWCDAWESHRTGRHDRRNVLAVLCTLSVLVSIGASIATTGSSLTVSSGEYLRARQQQEAMVSQIRQKQDAVDVCTEANRITLCAIPLQKEIDSVQAQLNGLVIPSPDAATALVMEVGSMTGLSFDEATTLVIAIISIMLDAAGLYFLFLQSEPSEEVGSGCIQAYTEPQSDIELSVKVYLDGTLKQALVAIEKGRIKPSVRSLTDHFGMPQYAAQTILYWLSEAGHLEKQGGNKGYVLSSKKQIGMDV